MNIKDTLNIKDILFIVALTLSVIWVTNFLLPKKAIETPGSFVATDQESVRRPLNKEVDFSDAKRTLAPKEDEIFTQWGHLVFSTDGASLERCGFARNLDGKRQTFYTIFPASIHEREKKCFLVACFEETPFYYRLIERDDRQDGVSLKYEGQNSALILQKTFFVYNDKPQIDLLLEVRPTQKGGSTRLRIFYPSPLMPLTSSDSLSFEQDPRMAKASAASILLMHSGGTSLEKLRCENIKDNQGWEDIQFFGSDSRYAIHALINDPHHFVRRAYLAHTLACIFITIIEGPETKEESSWSMSFYMGPKDVSLLNATDPRLEQTLDYSGFLGPIAKVLLAIMRWLYQQVGNYGFAIILLTVLMKILLLPLSLKSATGMKHRLEVQKKLEYINRHYRHDPKLLEQERAELIRKYGLPNAGGMLLSFVAQGILLFAMQRVLNGALEMYHAPMLWIPDLSASDPYYILPVLITLATLLQAMTVDVKQRFAIIAVAFAAGAFSTGFSAGLALFWVTNTLLGVLQSGILRLFHFA